jgi:hypothetical protein
VRCCCIGAAATALRSSTTPKDCQRHNLNLLVQQILSHSNGAQLCGRAVFTVRLTVHNVWFLHSTHPPSPCRPADAQAGGPPTHPPTHPPPTHPPPSPLQARKSMGTHICPSEFNQTACCWRWCAAAAAHGFRCNRVQSPPCTPPPKSSHTPLTTVVVCAHMSQQFHQAVPVVGH